MKKLKNALLKLSLLISTEITRTTHAHDVRTEKATGEIQRANETNLFCTREATGKLHRAASKQYHNFAGRMKISAAV